MDIFISEDDLGAMAEQTLQRIFKTPPYNIPEQTQHIINSLKDLQRKVANNIVSECQSADSSAGCPVLTEAFCEQMG